MYRFNAKDSKGQFSSVIRLSDNKEIQLNPSDPDFAEFMLWVSKGNKPEQPKVAPEIKEVVEEKDEVIVKDKEGNSEKKTSKKKWRDVLDKKMSSK